jgi:small subunit ribosomal protein S5
MTPENITEETPETPIVEEATPPSPTPEHAPSSDRGERKFSKDRRNDKGGRRDRGDKREKPKKEFDELLLEVRRVTRVTTGGRRMSFRATILIGNKKGKI